MIEIVLTHKPFRYERPRFHNGRVYVPHGKAKRATQLILMSKYNGDPISQAFRCRFEFYIQKPRTIKNIPVFHTATPDLDNLVKFYMDAGIGFLWDDDKFCVELSAVKNYSLENKILITAEVIDAT